MMKILTLIIGILIGQLFAQHRGLWIVRNSLNTQEDLKQLEQIHQRLNLTDIYLQVRALGSDVYSEEKASNLKLEEIVQFSHDNNIKLHGWINVLFIWSNNQKPKTPKHPLLMDEDHLLFDQSGEYPDLKSLRKKGIEGYFIDPNSFSNKTQIEKLIKKLIAEYHFDGIHLDYIRYPDNGIIFSKNLRTLFMKKYFIDPLILFRESSDNYQGQALYRNFLLNQLSTFVENLKNVAKQMENSCTISMAVKPDFDQAKSEYYQDWLTWLKRGSCDYVLMMNYSPDEFIFNKNLVKANALVENNRIVCGIGAYYLDGENLERRIKLVEETQLKGYALFSFTTLKNKPGLLTLINNHRTTNNLMY